MKIFNIIMEQMKRREVKYGRIGNKKAKFRTEIGS